MNVTEIKENLAKPATLFQTGGFKPTNERGESWIGGVIWGDEKEEIPTGYEPLSTLFLENLPAVPEELTDYSLITIYADPDVFENPEEDDLSSYFQINCYSKTAELHQLNHFSTVVKPFPLKGSLVPEDFPTWEYLDEINPEVFEAVMELEEDGDIEDYSDIVEEWNNHHKVGGYPSLGQNAVYHGEEYVFAFQITTDHKAQFYIEGQGTFFFFFNPKTSEWIVSADFE